MSCVVGQRRKWRHTWSAWKLFTATGTTYQFNQRHCTRCDLTQNRSA